MTEKAALLSAKINWVVERLIGLIMLLLVLDVWLGVIDRYIFHWQLPWPEALARYLMIWMALLAISAGIARREHIGLTMFIDKLPKKLRAPILFTLDLLCVALFVCIAFYGIGFAEKGAAKQAMIFDITLLFPYLSVPVSMLLAAVQTILVAFRDQGELKIVTLSET